MRDPFCWGNLSASTCYFMKDREYYEQLRNRYLPERLKVIFIFESPPFSGKYFYDPAGSKSEQLFVVMMKYIGYSPENKEDGLKEFSKRGYFLMDATYNQIDKVTNPSKRNLFIVNDIPLLASKLLNLEKRRGVKIIPVKKNICQIVSGPLKSIGFNVLDISLPFPFPNWQPEFFEKMLKLKKEYNLP